MGPALLAAYPVPAEEAWRTTVNVAKIETPNQAQNQHPGPGGGLDRPALPTRRRRLQRQIGQGDHRPPGEEPPRTRRHPSRRTGRPAPSRPPRPPRDPPGLREAAAEQGYRADFLRKHGAADGRFYYQRGIDAVIFGIDGDGLHGPDEYADTTTIAPYYQALTDFLGNPAGD